MQHSKENPNFKKFIRTIANLTPLQDRVNLRKLYLHYYITNPSPIKELTNLTTLYLIGNNIVTENHLEDLNFSL